MARAYIQAVIEKDPDVPIVRSTWVAACKQTGQRLPFSTYRLPVLYGCTLSFTNVPKRRRFTLQKQVELFGGSVAPDMSKSCSYLVVGPCSTVTAKLRCE